MNNQTNYSVSEINYIDALPIIGCVILYCCCLHCVPKLIFHLRNRDNINIDNLNYDQYISQLQELFGKKNVYIYKYKDMKNDIQLHVKGICDFIGVDTPKFRNKKRNIGYSLWQLKLSLFINKVIELSF